MQLEKMCHQIMLNREIYKSKCHNQDHGKYTKKSQLHTVCQHQERRHIQTYPKRWQVLNVNHTKSSYCQKYLTLAEDSQKRETQMQKDWRRSKESKPSSNIPYLVQLLAGWSSTENSLDLGHVQGEIGIWRNLGSQRNEKQGRRFESQGFEDIIEEWTEQRSIRSWKIMGIGAVMNREGEGAISLDVLNLHYPRKGSTCWRFARRENLSFGSL